MPPVSKEFHIRNRATAPSASKSVDATDVANMQAHRTFKLAERDLVCIKLDRAEQMYKAGRPATGVHPMGPCRQVFASALIEAFADIAGDPKGPFNLDDVCQQYSFAKELAKAATALVEHSKTEGFGFLQPLVAYCTYTHTKENHRLLKIRPLEHILSGEPWKKHALQGCSSKDVLECLLLPHARLQCEGPGLNLSTYPEKNSVLEILKADFDKLTATRALGDARSRKNPDALKEAIERARSVGTPTRSLERLLAQIQDRSSSGVEVSNNEELSVGDRMQITLDKTAVAKKQELFMTVKKDDVESMKQLIAELPTELNWKTWKDYAGRSLRQYAIEVGANKARRYLEASVYRIEGEDLQGTAALPPASPEKQRGVKPIHWGHSETPNGARRLPKVLQMVDCPDSHGLQYVFPAGDQIRCCDACGQIKPSEVFFACAGQHHTSSVERISPCFTRYCDKQERISPSATAERNFKICRSCAAREAEEELAVRSAAARNALDLPELRAAVMEVEYLSGNGTVPTSGADTNVIAEARRKINSISRFAPLENRQQQTPKEQQQNNKKVRRPHSALAVSAEAKSMTLKEWLEELDPSLSSGLVTRAFPILEEQCEHLASLADLLESDGVEQVLWLLENTRVRGSRSDPEPLTGQQELLLRHGAGLLLRNGLKHESARLRQDRELRLAEVQKAKKNEEHEVKKTATLAVAPWPIAPWLQGVAKETRCKTLCGFESSLVTQYDDLYELACAGSKAVLKYLDDLANPPGVREKQLLTMAIQRLNKFGPEEELKRLHGRTLWTRPAPISPWLQGVAQENRCDTLVHFEGWLVSQYEDLYKLAEAGSKAVLEYLDSVADPPPRVREKQLLTRAIGRLGKLGPQAELQRFYGCMFWTNGFNDLSCGGEPRSVPTQTDAMSSAQTQCALSPDCAVQTDRRTKPPTRSFANTQTDEAYARNTRSFATQKDAPAQGITTSSASQTNLQSLRHPSQALLTMENIN